MAEAGQRLGTLLMRAGIITDRQLNDALEVHRATGSPLGRILVDLGYASQGAILSVMAKQIGIEYVDFAETRPDPAAVMLVPKELATRYILMPVEIREDQLVVAMADPQNVLALDDLRIITSRDIKPAISTKDDILAAIEEYYREAETEEADLFLGTDEVTDEALAGLTSVESEAPAVKLVNYIIQKAVADRASDIHIEPQEHDLRVRFRVDGVLHEAMTPAPSRPRRPLSRVSRSWLNSTSRNPANRRTVTALSPSRVTRSTFVCLHCRLCTGNASYFESCAKMPSCSN